MMIVSEFAIQPCAYGYQRVIFVSFGFDAFVIRKCGFYNSHN